jgi:hypothetical protein
MPDHTDRRVLQSVSLLTRVGWDDERDSEGKAVTEFMGLDWLDSRMRVHKFENEGFIAKQGRYRYVTPHLLAVWMASEVWNALGMRTLGVIEKLPTLESRRAVLERLYDLGDDPHAQKVTGSLLETPQVYPDIDAIGDERRAEIFSLLAQTNPDAGLQALQRLIEHLPRNRLLNFSSVRREIVHLLEKLAWQPDTFFGAARLLLQLADAENETWGNNASGVWTGLFGTRLGVTAVPALDRHILVQEALDSDSINRNLLAVNAIRHILTWQEARFSAGNRQGGRLVAPEWRPKTIAEDQAIRQSGLAMLDKALNHAALQVRDAAREVLLDLAHELIFIGLADGVIERLERLPVASNDERQKMRSIIEELLEYDAERLTPEQKNRLSTLHEQILGSSFSDRLHRWTGPPSISDWRRQQGESLSAEEQAAALADEAMQNPELLRPELSYLVLEAHINYHFARRLGQLDVTYLWWEEILDFIRQGQGYAFASAYLQGQLDAGRGVWRDAILDAWTSAGGALSLCVLDAVWRSAKPSDADAERLINLLERGELSGSRIGTLIMGGQTSTFSSSVFRRLVESVLRDDSKEATASALALIYQRLSSHIKDQSLLADVAWKALDRHEALVGDSMTRFYADELAKRYQAQDPLRIVRTVLKFCESHDRPLLRSDPMLQMLERATHSKPMEVWKEVSAWLTSEQPHRFQLYLALRGWYAEVVGADIVLSWAESHLPDGPELVAAFTDVGGSPLNFLARELLIRYSANDHVKEALYANYGSGSFTGPHSVWLSHLRDTAFAWLSDPHVAVRDWARPLIDDFDRQIKYWQREEEEGGF